MRILPKALCMSEFLSDFLARIGIALNKNGALCIEIVVAGIEGESVYAVNAQAGGVKEAL